MSETLLSRSYKGKSKGKVAQCLTKYHNLKTYGGRRDVATRILDHVPVSLHNGVIGHGSCYNQAIGFEGKEGGDELWIPNVM
jgi:hypothetical protein